MSEKIAIIFIILTFSFSSLVIAERLSQPKEDRVVKSSTASIGAFAKDWHWSKNRNQDGICAETKIDIDLPENFNRATLIIKVQHSQYNGSGTADVYICDGQQLEPDSNHNKGSWWLSNTGMMGKNVGTIYTKSILSTEKIDVTEIIREYPCNTYYIAIRNNSDEDIGVPEIYLEIER